jgi:hypothetical protein
MWATRQQFLHHSVKFSPLFRLLTITTRLQKTITSAWLSEMATNGARLNCEEEEKKQSEALDISPKAIGLIAVAFALPVDICITHLGDAEKGRAAAIFIAATCITIMYRWNLKRMWWFWTTMVVMAIAQGYLVQRIHWYKGSLPAVSLLPAALILSAIQFGCVELAKKILSRSSPR